LEKLLRNTRAGIPEFLSDRSRTSPNAGEWNLFEEDKVVLQKICWDTKILNVTSVQAATLKRSATNLTGSGANLIIMDNPRHDPLSFREARTLQRPSFQPSVSLREPSLIPDF
jgi:hypothetical protein